MNCPEVSPLVTRFFDGELEGRQMRAVALHVTRCTDCEQDLRQLEGLQAMLGAQIAERVDAIDMSQVWAGVSARIAQRPQSLWERLTNGIGFELPSMAGAWPALAGAAAAVALTVGFWTYPSPDVVTQPLAVRSDTATFQTAELFDSEVADEIIDSPESEDGPDGLVNSAVFDSIVGSVRELSVDPETGTTVVWVSDSGDMP